jgi:hypothetical protein
VGRLLRLPAMPVVHFVRLAGPGARVGLVLAVILLLAYAGSCLRTGLGTILDVLCGVVLGVILLVSVMSIVMLGLTLVRRIPLRLSALIAGAVAGLIVAGHALGLSVLLAIYLGTVPLLLVVLAGAGLSVLLRRGPGQPGTVPATLAVLMLLTAVVTAGVLIFWLAAPGTDPFLAGTQPVTGGHVSPLDAPDPSRAGPCPIASLCYGSGTDRHRPEYGQKVDLKTDCVDASSFLPPSPKRLGAWVRRKYWGFESNNLPLNARVWFPKDDGTYPLVLIVHGNHRMDQFSDPGYAYLGELLASRGFIVASIDENFFNRSWAGDLGGGQGARAWLLLKHLELWRRWNEQEGHPFYQKVDLANIALIGHSRGGEAIVHAAEFNQLRHHPNNANVPFHFGFAIKTLIALAPTEGQYQHGGPSVPLRDINYLVLQGSHDGDLRSFFGAERYRRIAFTGEQYRMKAALYIYRANHAQFNTVWGSCDQSPPAGYLLNRGPILGPEDQRTIAKVYLTAFLEATLHEDPQYIPLFRDHHHAAHWLPETVYFSRFQDSDFHTITDFDEATQATETTVPGGSQQGEHLAAWNRREMKARNGQPIGDCAVVLGWNTEPPRNDTPTGAPSYTITLPEVLPPGWWLDEQTILSFCLADTGEQCPPALGADPAAASASPGAGVCGPAGALDPNRNRAPIDLTLELVASNGCTASLPLSRCLPLQPALKVTFSKWRLWEHVCSESPVEPVLQTFEIPLAAFTKASPEFAPALLRQVRFRFDRTRAGVLLLDNVGLAQNRFAAPGNPG